MNAEKQLRSSFDRLAADKRTGVHHLALFGTLARLWKDSKYASPFAINRQRVKEASKLRSVNACDQALRELDKWAYLRYFPLQSVGHRCGKRTAAQRNAAQFNSEPEGLIRLNLTDTLSS
ncbi:MAG: hypothetical protein H7Z75_21290, partial [Ferruginibacter sp.]|nr:hypothetical protein [Cytophagales bacterium]